MTQRQLTSWVSGYCHTTPVSFSAQGIRCTSIKNTFTRPDAYNIDASLGDTCVLFVVIPRPMLQTSDRLTQCLMQWCIQWSFWLDAPKCMNCADARSMSYFQQQRPANLMTWSKRNAVTIECKFYTFEREVISFKWFTCSYPFTRHVRMVLARLGLSLHDVELRNVIDLRWHHSFFRHIPFGMSAAQNGS